MDGEVPRRRRRRRHGRDVHQGQLPHPAEGHVLEIDEYELEQLVVKRRKLSPLVLIGHKNLNNRHAMQFYCLSALISGKGNKTIFPADQECILHDDTSPGLYMEWCDSRETNFLWLSSPTEQTSIKCEVLAVFEPDVMESEEKRPLLAFSEGFDDGAYWTKTKLLLMEVFGHPGAGTMANPNYIYTFTRIRQKIHLDVFKVLGWSDEDPSRSKLKRTFPSFVLKPETLHCSDNIFRFIDENLLCIDDTTTDFGPTHAILSSSRIPYVVEHLRKESVFLPPPFNTTEWEGFNTTLGEYFQRYLAFKKSKILGTGPVPPPFDKVVPAVPLLEYYHLCLPFKMFARSLFIQCDDAFSRNECFEEIKVKNIFFRGKEVKLLGVKLIAYSEIKAVENVKEMGSIIYEVLIELGLSKKDFPKDLHHVLFDILKLDIHTKEVFSLEDFDRVKCSTAWMDSLDKIHMMDDLFDEFMYKMTPYSQMRVGKGFPSFKDLDKRLNKNWLMKEISNFPLMPKDSYTPPDPKRVKKYHAKGKAALSDLLNGCIKNVEGLYAVQQAFKTPRNAFHHFTDTARKYYGDVLREEVELAVSSEYSDIYIEIQEGMTEELKHENKRKGVDNGRSVFSRFERYFLSPDKVQFKDRDKK